MNHRKKILISCNMGIQHIYFAKSFIEKYKNDFEIKILFQSHIEETSFFKKVLTFAKKNGFTALSKKVLCKSKYTNIINKEKKDYYNSFYSDVKLDDLYETLGKDNIIISNDVNSSNSINFVKKFSPHIFLLQGGKLLKNEFIECLSHSYILHLHLGIVPYYRGGSSQFWSIYNNAIEENGFTIQSVDLGIDTGSIYIRKTVKDFDLNDTHHSMYCKTQIEGINAIKSLIDYYISNDTIPSPIHVVEKGVNYSANMITDSAKEYVCLNRERVILNHKKNNPLSPYKDISVI